MIFSSFCITFGALGEDANELLACFSRDILSSMGKRNFSFRFVLTGSFLSILLLFTLLVLVSFLSLFSTTSKMQARINRYMNLNALTKEIESCRLSFSSYFDSLTDGPSSSLMEAAQLRGGLVRSRLVLKSIGEPAMEDGEAYFTHRAILNGLEYLEKRSFRVKETDYVEYYRLLKIFDYLNEYSSSDYLSYAIANDTSAAHATWVYLTKLGSGVVISTIVLFLLVILFLVFFSGYMSKPIQSMANAATQLTLGNYDIPELPAEGPRELASLEESLNQMKRSIKERDELARELYEENLKNSEMARNLSRAHYQALQAQINPHFLFNVLNTLSHTAFLENAEKSVLLTNTIASFYRYTLDFQNEVMIKEELEFCRLYLVIQQQRFGGRLRFVIECDPNLSELFIPPVVIQPFVENAVVHGLEPTEDGGIVRVTVLRDSWQRVAVVVQDDGIGIDPSGRKKDDGGRVHIGIENVYERLQVYFESQATVTVERASQSGGTRAVLLFPARRERWA